jgi:hypothetical protein
LNLKNNYFFRETIVEVIVEDDDDVLLASIDENCFSKNHTSPVVTANELDM